MAHVNIYEEIFEQSIDSIDLYTIAYKCFLEQELKQWSLLTMTRPVPGGSKLFWLQLDPQISSGTTIVRSQKLKESSS